MLQVSGDAPVDSCCFSDERVSLICHTDLFAHSLAFEEVKKPAESLARLYLEQGENFAASLHGSFSIILFDRRDRTLRAWIDHFGVRRLVYFSTPLGLAVASDFNRLKPAAEGLLRIDPAAVLDYLEYCCIPGPRTIYRGAKKLEPGQMLTSRPAPSVRSYWDVPFNESRSGSSERQWATGLFQAIQQAVARTADSRDGQLLGTFLSGGTDSSSITGLLGQITAEPARSFSIGFDDRRYNEISYARIAAKRYSCDHHEYFVKPEEISSLARKASRLYDEPFGNSSIIPTYYCAKLAAGHGVTHLLAGDGGDELFGGNERYVKDPVFERYNRLPAWVRRRLIEPSVRAGAAVFGHGPLDLAARYVRRASLPLPDRLFSYSFLASALPETIFDTGFRTTLNGSSRLEAARRYYGAAPSSSYVNRWLYLDLKITIGANDLVKVTRMCDLAGVTARYPLLDWKLAEFAGTIPPALKVRRNQLRYLFKKAMTPVLPKEIIKKQKHGFGLPYSVWVGENAGLKEFTFDVLGSARCRQRGYFRPDLFEWLWRQYEEVDRTYFGDLLWVFLMLELWHLEHSRSAL